MRGAHRSSDPVEHAVDPKKGIVVPEPQYPITAPTKKFATHAVVIGLPEVEMPAAIEFHDQFGLQADEIGEVGADSMLPAEFPAKQAAVAQILPKPQLGFGLMASQAVLSGMILSAAHDRRSLTSVSGWRTGGWQSVGAERVSV